MLSFNEYQNRMTLIGIPNPSISQYYQYTFCESKWLEYFIDIFIPNINLNRPYISIIIMESCPGPNNEFPHQNYIFNNLDNDMNGRTDSYLWQTYRGFFLPNPAIPANTSKFDALVQLAQENVLLIDIIPTHQINLNQNLRQSVINNLENVADFTKVNSMLNYLNGIVENPFSFKSITSLGSSYNPQLNNINNMVDNSVFLGSMTDPTSHYPSYNLLNDIINNGF